MLWCTDGLRELGISPKLPTQAYDCGMDNAIVKCMRSTTTQIWPNTRNSLLRTRWQLEGLKSFRVQIPLTRLWSLMEVPARLSGGGSGGIQNLQWCRAADRGKPSHFPAGVSEKIHVHSGGTCTLPHASSLPRTWASALPLKKNSDLSFSTSFITTTCERTPSEEHLCHRVPFLPLLVLFVSLFSRTPIPEGRDS